MYDTRNDLIIPSESSKNVNTNPHYMFVYCLERSGYLRPGKKLFNQFQF